MKILEELNHPMGFNVKIYNENNDYMVSIVDGNKKTEINGKLGQIASDLSKIEGIPYSMANIFVCNIGNQMKMNGTPDVSYTMYCQVTTAEFEENRSPISDEGEWRKFQGEMKNKFDL